VAGAVARASVDGGSVVVVIVVVVVVVSLNGEGEGGRVTMALVRGSLAVM
jgi:hypothetical protein